MMNRAQIASLDSRIVDLASDMAAVTPAVLELADIASQFRAEVQQSRCREAQLRADHAALVAACRASVAAARLAEPNPLIHIEHRLAAHGWLPGEGMRPAQLLAAVSDLRRLLHTAA